MASPEVPTELLPSPATNSTEALPPIEPLLGLHPALEQLALTPANEMPMKDFRYETACKIYYQNKLRRIKSSVEELEGVLVELQVDQSYEEIQNNGELALIGRWMLRIKGLLDRHRSKIVTIIPAVRAERSQLSRILMGMTEYSGRLEVFRGNFAALQVQNAVPALGPANASQNSGQPLMGIAPAASNPTANVSQSRGQSTTSVTPTAPNTIANIPQNDGQSSMGLASAAPIPPANVSQSGGQSVTSVTPTAPNIAANVPQNGGQLSTGVAPAVLNPPTNTAQASAASNATANAPQNGGQSATVRTPLPSSRPSSRGSSASSSGGGPLTPQPANVPQNPGQSSGRVAPAASKTSVNVSRNGPSPPLPFYSPQAGLTVRLQTAARERNEGLIDLWSIFYRGDTTDGSNPPGKHPSPERRAHGVMPWAAYQILARSETGQMTKGEIFKVGRAWLPDKFKEWRADGKDRSNEQTLRRALTMKGIFKSVPKSDANGMVGYWRIADVEEGMGDRSYERNKNNGGGNGEDEKEEEKKGTKRSNPFKDDLPAAKKPQGPSSSSSTSSSG